MSFRHRLEILTLTNHIWGGEIILFDILQTSDKSQFRYYYGDTLFSTILEGHKDYYYIEKNKRKHKKIEDTCIF